MEYYHRSVAWLEGVAFTSLALAVISLAFCWMPSVGVIIGAAALLIGFFGWIAAAQYHDGSSPYLLTGAGIAVLALVLNLTLVTGTIPRFF
jgi:hypothetical protein